MTIIQKENEAKKKADKIELLNKEKKYQVAVKNAMFGGMLLFSILTIVIFLFFWRKKKDNKKIRTEQEKSEKLLLNVLPSSIANRLKDGETAIADHFDEASVVFIDVVDFTIQNKGASPEKIVETLNTIYTEFDKIANKHGLEKIKTIGDCYMAAAGIPESNPKHAESAANFALEAMQKMDGFDSGNGTTIRFRCGLDCGPAVAGVIGKQKFIYDLWGDMVNTASRMETNGIIGKIQCTERFVKKLENRIDDLGINIEERGEIEVKGKGLMKTYFIN